MALTRTHHKEAEAPIMVFLVGKADHNGNEEVSTITEQVSRRV